MRQFGVCTKLGKKVPNKNLLVESYGQLFSMDNRELVKQSSVLSDV